MGVSGIQSIFGWVDFTHVSDLRAKSGLLYRYEYKPTISSLDDYDAEINEKTADYSKDEKLKFINGKDEAFIRNANWANGAVSLSISKEGMEKCDQKTEFLRQHIVLSSHYYETKFNYDLNKAMDNSFINSKHRDNEYLLEDLSAEDWANCLMDTYAKAYDEIMTGYETGTRELYVPDENEESGFRKLTKEDELVMLRKEMSNQVDYLDRINEATQKAIEEKKKNSYEIQMHKYHAIVDDLKDKYNIKYFERLKEKIEDAVSGFEQAYQVGIDVNELRSRFKVKNTNVNVETDTSQVH